MKIIVIGGGAAGMMAAIAAAQAGGEVLLLEKNEKLGKKIFITGKGRCNVTNACDLTDFFDQIVSNPRFLYSSLYGFSNEDMIHFLEDGGCPLKTERGERVFPVSDKAYDITDCLRRYLNRFGVKVQLHTEVRRLIIQDGKISGVETGQGKLFADRVIVATGGMSYATTGSTGDGYRFAEEAGIEVTPLYPALVPLETEEKDYKDLQGLSLKNIEVIIEDGKRRLYENFGELLFTHFGLSGPVILSASSRVTKLLNQKQDRCKLVLHINLKPALSEKQLDERLLRDFEEAKNKQLKNAFAKLFPSKLIPVFLNRLEQEGIQTDQKVNGLTREDRHQILQLIRDFRFTLKGTRGFSEAIITQGGISVKELNPATMESRRIKGLYFAGEVIDIDAYTGGFNLQLAFSTGRLAGQSAMEQK